MPANQTLLANSASFKNDATPFPDDFWWGTSLSAHQAEGGNINSWSRWESQPGRIKNNEKSGVATGHWQKYKEDFDNLVWLGANTHRFSIEWSRLEPLKGQWDENAAARYREILSSLRERNIRPVLCLFHFTLPLWAEDEGGFENPQIIAHFVDFAGRAVEAFGDHCQHWLTLNEPVIYALGAYGAGLTPPGFKDLKRCLRVIANMMRVHGLTFQKIKSLAPQAQVSFAHHLRSFAPHRRFNLLDHLGAGMAQNIVNWSWFDCIQSGKLKLHIPFVINIDEDAPECLNSLDFLGFNYYSRDFISFQPLSKQKFFVHTSKEGPRTDMQWEIYPQGIVELMNEIKKRGLSKYRLLITENGIADKDDNKRPHFIYEHLSLFLRSCQALELKPMGYLYWSLLDNFEWIDGFGPRFGLFEVDYSTLKRSPRPSAHYFRQLSVLKSVIHPESIPMPAPTKAPAAV